MRDVPLTGLPLSIELLGQHLLQVLHGTALDGRSCREAVQWCHFPGDQRLQGQLPDHLVSRRVRLGLDDEGRRTLTSLLSCSRARRAIGEGGFSPLSQLWTARTEQPTRSANVLCVRPRRLRSRRMAVFVYVMAFLLIRVNAWAGSLSRICWQ